MNYQTENLQKVSDPNMRNSSISQNKDWRTLHQKFVEFGRNAKEWMRKCVFLLPEIEKHKIWKKKGFESIYEYARQIAGMSRDQVNDSLRILNKTENLPALRKIIEERGLNAVRPIIAIVTEETEKFWAEKAGIMANNTLRTYVKGFKDNRLEKWDIPSHQSVKEQPQLMANNEILKKIFITLELDPEVADQLNKLKGRGDWNSLMKEFLELRKEKSEAVKPEVVQVKPMKLIKSDSETDQKNYSKVYTSRAIPKAIKTYVLAKTNSTCAFPNCKKPSKILHHTDRFAMYGLHDPDTIVALCKAHERLAHLGLIENEDKLPRFWKIRKQADFDNPKYEIDVIVEKYRNPGYSQEKQKCFSSSA